MNGVIEKAHTLIEALPYIRTFFGKTFVIKYGGHAMINEELKKSVILDLILLKYVGVNPVLVHGGGPAVSAMMEKLGKEPVFVDGLRVTDEETMEIAEMVLSGQINKEIVSLIGKYGGQAVGISGKDGNTIIAKKKMGEVDLGHVGEVDKINPELIKILNKEGFIPVISSIGVGYAGESYNINADWVAGEMAIALQAAKLLLLTDVEGIYEEPGDPSTLISALQIERARKLIAQGKIGAGMIPKVNACIKAIENGVERTHVIDGRTKHSMLLEIFTDKGIGTMVVA
jgi:acetylglutamate kinase